MGKGLSYLFIALAAFFLLGPAAIYCFNRTPYHPAVGITTMRMEAKGRHHETPSAAEGVSVREQGSGAQDDMLEDEDMSRLLYGLPGQEYKDGNIAIFAPQGPFIIAVHQIYLIPSEGEVELVGMVQVDVDTLECLAWDGMVGQHEACAAPILDDPCAEEYAVPVDRMPKFGGFEDNFAPCDGETLNL